MRRTPPTENIPLIKLPRWVRRQGTAPTGAAASHPPHGPVPTTTIFTREWLANNLVGAQIRGAYDVRLRAAMLRLADHLKGAPPVRPAPAGLLEEIARLRGRDLAEVKEEYAKFAKLYQEAYGLSPDPRAPLKEAYEPLSEANRGFMCGETQLRYGSVVGQALGVDPVFGAMLNPTGGLVGPGNYGLDLDSDAVGYHGITHDAAGYLYNHHGLGPGYDYLHREREQGGFGVNTGDPFTGQREGIRFWRTEMGVSNDIMGKGLIGESGQMIVDRTFRDLQAYAEVKADVVRGAEAVGHGIQHVAADVREGAHVVADGVQHVAAEVREGARVVGDRALDVGRWIAHAAVDRDISNPWIM